MNIAEIVISEAAESKSEFFTRLLPKDPDDPKFQQALHQVAKTIQIECSDFLSAFISSDRLMYSGIRGVKARAFRASSPATRRSVGGDQSATHAFDQMLSQLGFEATRSNSIYTTSNIHLARNFGKLYVIIPKNSAKYTWSQVKTDNNMIILNSEDIEPFIQWPFSKDAITTEIKIMRKQLGSSAKDSHQIREYLRILEDLLEPVLAVDKQDENFIRQYYPKSPAIALLDQLADTDSRTYDLKKFQKKFRMKKDRLVDALQSGNEILIHGEYYAFSHLFWPNVESLLLRK